MKKIMAVLTLISLMFLVTYPGKTQAATAEALTSAFEASSATSKLYTGDDAASSVMSSFGNISPRAGGSFAVLSTGNATITNTEADFGLPGEAGDAATLTLGFTVPSDMNSLLFDFYFLSQEYPEWVGQFNDTFTATITGSSKVADGTNVAIDPEGHVIEVNSVTFAIIGAQAAIAFQGTDFENNGGTGWLIAGAPVEAGNNITLTFTIQDVGDGVVPSTVLLDNFRFDQGQLAGPGVQSKLFFNQSILNITGCGQTSLNLYSSTVVTQDLTVNIANSNPGVLSLTNNQVTIPQYSSQAIDKISMNGLVDGTATLTATAAGFDSGAVDVVVSGCPILPQTGPDI